MAKKKSDVNYHVRDLVVVKTKDTDGAVCFSKDGSYYGSSGSLASNPNVNVRGKTTSTYIVICDLDQYDINGDSQIGSNGKCKLSSLQQPAYLVEWSRFGGINLFKWSGSDWTIK